MYARQKFKGQVVTVCAM